MKKKFLLVLLLVVVTLVLYSCKKDSNENPAADYINESENLSIPASIDLPPNDPGGYARTHTFYAVGVQKYKAQPKSGSNPVTYEWVLTAPLADLYNPDYLKAGTHTAGPSWQLTGTADSIFAQHFTPKRTAPATDAASVDWLLLMPKAGKVATGAFANTAYIQRIATKGGKAPATLPVSVNDTVDIPYTAVYRFSKMNP